MRNGTSPCVKRVKVRNILCYEKRWYRVKQTSFYEGVFILIGGKKHVDYIKRWFQERSTRRLERL